MNVQWWCAASDQPWSWSPQAYPGIWLFVVAVALAYALAARRTHDTPTRGQWAWFGVGWVLLWLALDWPLGPLGAGYLLSAHMLQYVLLIWFVTPLLVSSLSPAMRARLARTPGLAWWLERPFRSFLLFNTVLVVTHIPLVADTLKPLQFGSMAIDLVWFASAFLFWLAIAPDPQAGPERVDANYGSHFLYVMGIKILPILLGALLVLAEFPLYATFELAARVVEGLPARNDQVLAGWLMWMGTTPILVYRLGAAFFTWHAIEEQRAPGP